MIEALEKEFRALLELDVPDKNGRTQRQGIEQALNSLPQNDPHTKELQAQLERGTDIPAPLEHVWGWFWSLHEARTQSANGPNPLTYSDIKSWGELWKTWPRPLEIRVIKRLDSIYLSFVAEKQAKETPKTNPSKNKKSK